MPSLMRGWSPLPTCLSPGGSFLPSVSGGPGQQEGSSRWGPRGQTLDQECWSENRCQHHLRLGAKVMLPWARVGPVGLSWAQLGAWHTPLTGHWGCCPGQAKACSCLSSWK